MTKPPLLRLTMRLEDTDPLCEVCTLPVRVGLEDFRACAACGVTHIDCYCDHWLARTEE